MPSGYYVRGPDRSEHVRKLFGRIANRYDLINDLQSFGLHRLWKRTLIRSAGLKSSESILDVCCGTGDIALGLQGEGRRVVGSDFSPEMLFEARRRGAANISWVQSDALRLPFPNASFDVVTIGYGLRNLADLECGVAELLRVLRPGGRLLILDFGKPCNGVWRACYFAYLRIVVPVFGLVFCGDSAAYGYILDSLREYPAQEGVTRLLREMAEVKLVNFLGGAMSLHIARKR